MGNLERKVIVDHLRRTLVYRRRRETKSKHWYNLHLVNDGYASAVRQVEKLLGVRRAGG
jgi:hypothetical protein